MYTWEVRSERRLKSAKPNKRGTNTDHTRALDEALKEAGWVAFMNVKAYVIVSDETGKVVTRLRLEAEALDPE